VFPNKSILATTDLTRQCEPALRTAAALAAITGADLHVFHALELRENPYVKRSDEAGLFRVLVKEAEDGLAEQVRQTISGVVPKSVRSIMFLPWKAIVQRAREVEADLIVMGPHTHAFGDRFLGATADRVVRFANAPSLIVRDILGPEIERIVVAIDGSAASELALREAAGWAAGFAATNPCELHIVYSAADNPFPSAGASLIDAAVHTVGMSVPGNVEVRGELLLGRNAADDVKSYAHQHNAQLLILGTSGHGAIDRLLTGSVTSEVALTVSCPVLIVPTRSAAAEAIRRSLDDAEFSSGSGIATEFAIAQ
jgi:nucleotide-binding universal stress UspA family protein